mmetsp:Transcript_16104/g.39202  ORF Transcript_16104/g.39202 Transcript_16104/m.39202 type:complete len:201 (+) Transcript_16104:201-803(+)
MVRVLPPCATCSSSPSDGTGERAALRRCSTSRIAARADRCPLPVLVGERPGGPPSPAFLRDVRRMRAAIIIRLASAVPMRGACISPSPAGESSGDGIEVLLSDSFDQSADTLSPPSAHSVGESAWESSAPLAGSSGASWRRARSTALWELSRASESLLFWPSAALCCAELCEALCSSSGTCRWPCSSPPEPAIGDDAGVS